MPADLKLNKNFRSKNLHENMKILKHLASIAAITTSTLTGDQFAYVPNEVYQDAAKTLTPGTVVVEYCSLNEKSEPHVVEIVSLDKPAPKDVRKGMIPIRATVKSLYKSGLKRDGEIKTIIDLAYTYYPDHKGNYVRMSDLYNLKASGSRSITLDTKAEKNFQKQLDATAKIKDLYKEGKVWSPGRKTTFKRVPTLEWEIDSDPSPSVDVISIGPKSFKPINNEYSLLFPDRKPSKTLLSRFCPLYLVFTSPENPDHQSSFLLGWASQVVSSKITFDDKIEIITVRHGSAKGKLTKGGGHQRRIIVDISKIKEAIKSNPANNAKAELSVSASLYVEQTGQE